MNVSKKRFKVFLAYFLVTLVIGLFLLLSESAYNTIPTYTPQYNIGYDFDLICSNHNATISHIEFGKSSNAINVFLVQSWAEKSSLERQTSANDIGVELTSALKHKDILDNSDELIVNYYLNSVHMGTYSSKNGVNVIVPKNSFIVYENKSEI